MLKKSILFVLSTVALNTALSAQNWTVRGDSISGDTIYSHRSILSFCQTLLLEYPFPIYIGNKLVYLYPDILGERFITAPEPAHHHLHTSAITNLMRKYMDPGSVNEPDKPEITK